MSDSPKSDRRSRLRSRMLYERLEDRVLFDAVPDAPVDAEQLSGSGVDASFADRFEATASAVDVKVVTDQSLLPSKPDPAASVRRELVIIDRSVEQYQQLIDDLLRQQSDGRSISVETLDSEADGVAQISEILNGYRNLDSLQIVSHGDGSGLQLGDLYLTNDGLPGYASNVAGWGDALSSNADVLLLGCDLASGAQGRELLQSLQTLTGADIAASTDDTGYAPRGGDWDLEFLLGQTETTIAFSDSIQTHWKGLLGPGPSVSITTQDQNALIGEDVQFEVQFQNSASPGSGNVGYGPFIDLLFPANGADGQAGTDTPDGLQFQNATYLGQALDFTEVVFVDVDGAPSDNGTPGNPADDRGTSQLGYALHPYLKEVQNELQLLTLSGDIDGGQLDLTFNGQTTSIDLDATSGTLDALTLQSALEGLSSIGAGNVVVSNGSLPGEGLLIEFVGALATTDVSELVVDNSGVSLAGSTTDPRGAFAVNTITNGNQLAQASRIWGIPGDRLIVLELPFGSVTPEQPEVDIVVNATVSTLADAFTSSNPASELTVAARSGFRYGSDPVDNISDDPQLTSDIQTSATDWVESASIRPRVLTVETEILDEESETATGPNHPRTFEIRVDLPEGQTMSILDITDLLPDSLTFLSLDSITSTDPATVFSTNVPSGNNSLGNSTNNTSHTAANGHPPLDINQPRRDQSLVVSAGQITGSEGTDIVIRFQGYLSEFRHDASGNPDTPLIPVNGGPAPLVTQTGSASADWLAIDPRDQSGPAVGNAVSARSSSSTYAGPIVTQKSVTVAGGASSGFVAPGDILEYTIEFQVSDYFTVGDVIFSDMFSDGQTFYNAYDASAGIDFRPTFSLQNQTLGLTDQLFQVYIGAENTPTAEAPTDFFIVDRSDINQTDNANETGDGQYTSGGADPTSGQTTLTIRLSEQLAALGHSGILQGGHSLDGNANDTNTGASIGSITFYTQVGQQFTDSFPSGDRSLDHNDTITNNVQVSASIRENQEDGDAGVVLSTVTDTSSTKLDVESGVLTKSIYAVNGNTTLPDNLRLQPGDQVTYRLSYTLPNSDFESLVLTDFLPLPAMVVDDFNADEIGGDTWVFDSDGAFDAVVGTVELGPNDTFYHSKPGSSDYFSNANLSVDTVANSLTFDFGNYDDDASPTTEIDLLFTLQIQDDPFADGLFLTNIARATFGATNQVTEPTDALAKIQIGQPVLNIRKGVIATSDHAVIPSDVGPNQNSEFQTFQYLGSGGGETVTLTFGGETTELIPVSASALEVQEALEQLSTIGAGNISVSGSSMQNGDLVAEFHGTFVGSDVAEIQVGTNHPSGVPAVSVSTVLNGGDIITYSDVGDTNGFTGRLTSDALDQMDINANLLDVENGLEAGDTVRFMVVVENTGTGANGAFDVQLRDQLPREFQYVAGSLSVADGQGDSLTYTSVGTHPDHAFFGGGILLDDPGSTPAAPGGADAGALDRFSLHSGRNLAVITYDAVLVDTAALQADNVEYGEEITNEAVIVSYSGREGAEDHTPFRNEIQNLNASGTVTGGTYQLTYEGQTTSPIAWDATARQITLALESLSTIGTGNVLVSGSALTGSGFNIVFRSQLSDQNVFLVSVSDSGLTGSGSLSTSTTTEGSFNEIQTLNPSGAISGGTFTLTFAEETTAPLAWNADATTIQGALESLSGIPSGSIKVVGQNLESGDFQIEFTGALSQQEIAQLQVDATSLVGGSVTVGTSREGQAMDPRNSASVVIRGGSVDKSILTTSESHTSKVGTLEQVTIGEIVRYRVAVELPAGTQTNLQIVDHLPSGLAYLDDGTTELSFISDAPGSIVSTVGAGLLADSSVSSSSTSNIDRYGSGTDVWFSLGDVVNTETDANTEYAVVEFNAVVLNTAAVVQGVTLTNSASVHVNDELLATITPTNDQRVRVVEPHLTEPAKTVRMGTGSYSESVVADAGDVVDFRVTFQARNQSHDSDAFDVQVVDALPDHMELDASSLRVLVDGVLQTAGTDYVDATSSATDTIQITFDQLSPGQSVEILYSATLDVAVTLNEDLVNTVHVDYSSLPGSFGTSVSTSGSPTGNTAGSDLASLNQLNTNASGTDDASGITYTSGSGDLYGERNGQNSGASPNTYYGQDTATVNVDRIGTISKTLDGTSIDDSSTHGNNVANEAVIGELATYTITIRLNEGTLQDAQIIDTMDTGLTFVGVTSSSYSGVTLGSSANLNAPTVNTNGNVLTWDLGTIVDSVPSDISAAGDTDGVITITYDVVVENRASNTDGRRRNNSVEFLFNDHPVTGPQDSVSDQSNNVRIIEPEVTISKAVALDTDGDTLFDDGKSGDAGDRVQYQITLTNESGVDAFDVEFSDPLPQVGTGSAILAPTLTVTDTSTTSPVSASDFELAGSDSTGWTLRKKASVDLDLLASQENSAGQPRTITFLVEGTISSTVTPNLGIANTANVDWDSIDGDYVGPSAYTNRDTERTGAQGPSGNRNFYAASSTDTFTISRPVFTKHLIATDRTETSGSNVTIGETVTYGLYVSLPEGVTPDATVVDQLPAGLKYVNHQFVTTAAGSADINGNNLLASDFSGTITGGVPVVTGGAAAGEDVTFTFGQISVDVNNDSTDNGFLIIVRAQVIDTEATHGYVGNQTVLSNTGTIDVTGDGQGPQSVANPVDITVQEPSLNIEKEFGPTVNTDLADAGETVTVNLTVDNLQGTSTAYDIRIQDILNPAHYDLTTVDTGTAGTDYPADFTVAFNSTTGELIYSGGDLAAGASATFQISVQLLESVVPNQTLLNTATVTDASTLDGTVAGERNNPDADGDGSDEDTDTIRIRRNSLAGFVWDDLDNDGLREVEESGLSGVDIRLVGTDHLGNTITLNTQTLANGSYLFDNLRPGTYTIIQDPNSNSIPAGYLDGKEQAGTAGGSTSTNDRIGNISLPAGQETHATGNHFAEIQDSDLSGFVYHDANNNAAFSGSESGISGVDIRLTGKNDLNQDVSITVTTAANGAYVFTGLRPSDSNGYTITQLAEPSGYLDGKDSGGSLNNGDATSVNNVISSIQVVPGVNGTSYNFGELVPSTISGYVYHDSDNDGQRADEAAGHGIGGVQIRLQGTDDRGDAVNLVAVTDGSGRFEFLNLRPGAAAGYTLTQISDPAGYLDGKDTVGTAGGNGSTNNQFSGIQIVSGTVESENNFGELLPASLSGQVFNDHDNDGTFDSGDGETGIEGVTIRLTGTDDLGNAVDITLQTDSDGNYQFTNLRPSNGAGYTLSESQPAQYNDGQDTDGSLNNGITSTNDVISSIIVSSGNSGTGYTFANQGASISGLVYVDNNRDGNLDAGETNVLQGVTVELFDLSDPAHPVSLGTTVTNSSGAYSFDDLPAGDYRVVQTQPTLYGNVSSNTINLTLPVSGLPTAHFAEALFDIGNTIYFDANGNGIQNAGEQGIAGVQVTLNSAGADGIFGNADDPSATTTTTNAAGQYTFPELFVGNYRVSVTSSDLPAGVQGTQETDDVTFGPAAVDGQSQIAITNSDRFDVDFGYTGSGTAGGFVWTDISGDGIQNADEPPLADITVNLLFAGHDGIFGNDDDLTLSTTTASDGTYQFQNLPAGDFRIAVDTSDSDMPGSLTGVSGPDSISGTANFSLSTGATNNDVDFGFTGNRKVGDRVWLDADGNQAQNGNEPGLAGVGVTLVWFGQDGTLGTSDDAVRNVGTDATGNYEFTGLPDGNYRVAYTSTDLPAGISPTFELDGTTNNDVRFVLNGNDRSDVDFGFQGSGTIGDRVWLDSDADGVQDAGEPGLGSITVQLEFSGADGDFSTVSDNFQITTSTSGTGAYQFAGLPDGNYRVHTDTSDPDLPGSITPISGSGSRVGTVDVALSPATRTDNSIDFGFGGTRTIGDSIWLDLDGNGSQSVSEPGLGLVDVSLLFAGQDGIFGTSDDVTKQTTTAADGSFSFANLPDGSYRVSVDTTDLPSGVSATSDVDGTLDHRADFTISGSDRSDIDFGFQGDRSLGNFVWHDADFDGVQDSGEPGLNGIDIQLTAAGNDGVFGNADDFVLNTTTNSGGGFQFQNLPQGNYRISYDASDLPTGLTVGTFETDDSNATIDGTSHITVGSTDRLDVDFGFRGSHSLGDYVFFDANANGMIDSGDQGLGNVQVSLLFSGQDGNFGSADDVLWTTTTAADGSYSFAGLSDGAYRVSVRQSDLPSGLNQTMEGDGTTNNLLEVTIAGANIQTADFGYSGQGSIGDSVWLDADADRVQDAGEPGLADVSVNLVFAGADGTFGSADDFALTTQTDSDGRYQLQNLPAGAYRVAVDTNDPDLPGSLTAVSGTDSISGTANVTLAAGQTASNIDFGFAGTRSLGDRIWYDNDGNGAQDAVNEPGLVGVQVSLLFAGQDGSFGTSDDVTKSTTSGADGRYEFSALTDGDYQVQVLTASLPTGSVSTFDTDDSSFAQALDHVGRVTLNGASRNDVDFGYRGSLSLGDTFFHDTNGDGNQSSSEPGIAGVGVTATFAGGDGVFGTGDDYALSTTTNSSGGFQFQSLFSGAYRVSFDSSDLPSGMTVPTAEKDDSNAALDGVSHVNLTSNRSDLDFGFRGSFGIGDRIWLDGNADGIQDATNEPGIGGVDVTLLFAGPNGLFGDIDDATLSTTTGTDGHYQFTGLPNGNFRISYDTSDVPANVIQTHEVDGTVNNQAEVVVNGSDRNDVDFGVRGNRTVGRTVWFDADADGVQDANEPGLAGVKVSLTFAGDDGDFATTNDNFTVTTTTDANGNYQLSSLPDGHYRLFADSSDLPTGLRTITAERDDSSAALDGVSRIVVSSDRSDVNFGFRGTSTIESTVFYDENDDGTQNGSEVGIPGVTVKVEIDFTGDGVPDFTTTAVTDSTGGYTLADLPEGDVVITVTDPSGTTPTTDHDADGAGDNVREYGLTAGATDDSSTFGYLGGGSIGDIVYFDADADGAQDEGIGSDPAEPGLSGVSVYLDIDFNSDGQIDRTLSTITAADGTYRFMNLPAGQYTVRVTQPKGTTQTADADGITGTSANQSGLTLSPNQTRNDQDFGFTGTGSISDTVFFDIDNDGLKEVGTDDRGIENVDVTINIDVNGDGISDFTQTVKTDANGNFHFQNLIPGQYVITTDAADMKPGLAANPTVDNDGIATAHQAQYSVTPGAQVSGTGFGFHATPDYDITKTGAFTSARPGETIVYTIVVKNVGELDGRNVKVTDTFPKDILQITGTDGGTLDATAGTITWDLPALDPNQQQILTVTAVVRNPAASGLEEFTNSVSVQDDRYNGLDPDLTNNASSWKADLVAQPDYAITKTNGAAVDTLRPGDRTTYTITVTNKGNQDGTGIVVTDRFPVGILTVVDADGGTVDAANGTITWNLSALNSGTSIIFQPVFDVVSPANAAQEDVVNSATVNDDGKNGTDPNLADNTSTDKEVLLAAPDYRVSKWINGHPTQVESDSTITYSILVENVGDQDGTGVVVRDTYPTVGLRNVSAPGATIDAATGQIEWNVGALDGGESVLLTVTATVRADLPAGLHNLVNDVSVTDDLKNGPDPTPGNNSDQDVTFIVATPDLTIQKSDDDLEDVRPGETVWYTISYANLGRQEAVNVVITETVPEGSTFNAAESAAGWVLHSDGTATFEIDSLPTGASGEIIFAVTTNEILDPNREALVNVVTIRDDGANGSDADPGNNTAIDITPLQVYTFDSFEDFSGNENDLAEFNDQNSRQTFNDPNRNRLAPLPIDTVYTGVVDPGTTVTGKLYDEHGRIIGEQTVVADGAGNWLMQFPTVVVKEMPHSMQLQQTLAIQNDTFEGGFNLRRFFHPAVHSQVFMTSQLNVGSAYFHSPWNVLDAMHEANNNPLAFGWTNHNYEMVISSTNIASL